MIASVALAFVVVAFAVREWLTFRERQQWIEERSSLLNRIKPETAQITGLRDLDNQLVEPVRTDEDYWAAHEDNPWAEVGSDS